MDYLFEMENEEKKTELQHEAKPVLTSVASIEEIEEVAKRYFEVKYPLMDLNNDADKFEIDWYDMLQFVQHVLSCHCH